MQNEQPEWATTQYVVQETSSEGAVPDTVPHLENDNISEEVSRSFDDLTPESNSTEMKQAHMSSESDAIIEEDAITEEDAIIEKDSHHVGLENSLPEQQDDEQPHILHQSIEATKTDITADDDITADGEITADNTHKFDTVTNSAMTDALETSEKNLAALDQGSEISRDHEGQISNTDAMAAIDEGSEILGKAIAGSKPISDTPEKQDEQERDQDAIALDPSASQKIQHELNNENLQAPQAEPAWTEKSISDNLEESNKDHREAEIETLGSVSKIDDFIKESAVENAILADSHSSDLPSHDAKLGEDETQDLAEEGVLIQDESSYQADENIKSAIDSDGNHENLEAVEPFYSVDDHSAINNVFLPVEPEVESELENRPLDSKTLDKKVETMANEMDPEGVTLTQYIMEEESQKDGSNMVQFEDSEDVAIQDVIQESIPEALRNNSELEYPSPNLSNGTEENTSDLQQGLEAEDQGECLSFIDKTNCQVLILIS